MSTITSSPRTGPLPYQSYFRQPSLFTFSLHFSKQAHVGTAPTLLYYFLHVERPSVGATILKTSNSDARPLRQRRMTPISDVSMHQIRQCYSRETRCDMYDVGRRMKWLVELVDYMQVPPESAFPCVGCVLVRIRFHFEALGAGAAAGKRPFATFLTATALSWASYSGTSCRKGVHLDLSL